MQEKITVIKVGGGKNISYDTVIEELTEMKNYILVHGASNELNKMQEKTGKPIKKYQLKSGVESRRTDKEVLELFEMIYCGKVNKTIVEKMQKKGINAVGLSGVDGRLLEGKRNQAIRIKEGEKDKIVRDDLSGRVEKTNVKLVNLLLKNGFVPVIAPLAISYDNYAVNTDGDIAAAVLAKDMKAETMIFLSNVPGLMKDKEDPTTLLREINKENFEEAMNYAEGRMKKKMLAAKIALEAEVKNIAFGFSNVEKPIKNAMKGKGTIIK